MIHVGALQKRTHGVPLWMHSTVCAAKKKKCMILIPHIFLPLHAHARLKSPLQIFSDICLQQQVSTPRVMKEVITARAR